VSEGKKTPAWLLPALMGVGAAIGLTLGGTLGGHWKDPGWAAFVFVVRTPGVVFLSLLQALAVPLVMVSVLLAVANLGATRSMGRALGVTIAYFLLSTLLAVITGMLLVGAIQPGREFPMATASLPEHAATSTAEALSGVVKNMFPSNLFAAATGGNILGLIIFSALFGVVLGRLKERARPLLRVLEVLNDALMRFVRALIWFAPIGILALVADRIGAAGGGSAVREELGRLRAYSLTVVLGLSIHAIFTLPLILRLVARRAPHRFAGKLSDALLTAFATASSAATLAVTLRCLTEKADVSPRAAELVVPLGTTVNMNGTALYEAVAVIFIAQASGVPLGPAHFVVIALTATLAAVGAAAIPEAGLVTMVLVLAAAGLPPTGIGMLLSIDWILDRVRTAVNVWGDAVGAAVVDRWMPEEPASS
jgi:solute carrier family 1 (neuronal/epithelial high affinity glutamate transporter), member 1